MKWISIQDKTPPRLCTLLVWYGYKADPDVVGMWNLDSLDSNGQWKNKADGLCVTHWAKIEPPK